MLLQQRIKFIRHLHKHIIQIDGFLLYFDLLQIVSGNFKKFIDQAFQTAGLIQSDVHVPCSLLYRHIRSLVQEAQVTDD